MAPIEVSVAVPEDLEKVENLVADAIREPFDHPSLTADQRAENDWVVSITRSTCLAALV